jgi:hypothetical protein
LRPAASRGGPFYAQNGCIVFDIQIPKWGRSGQSAPEGRKRGRIPPKCSENHPAKYGLKRWLAKGSAERHGNFKKQLERTPKKTMFPPPFMARRSFEDRDEAMKSGKRVATFLAGISGFSGKDLDGTGSEVLAGTLSPWKGAALWKFTLCDWLGPPIKNLKVQ